ncbi:MAG: methyltransferase domain-containing protein [Acidobacteriia bacterium]|nr:methyltransferase domain-containing protein [Terriglobia bacterium]
MESAELIAILREVREKVEARHPQGTAGQISLPDLLPLVHARDAALGKVASIGTVNPRPGGPVNALVQGWKRLVARVLDWHVRDQVVFNRKVVECVDAAIEALNESNRALRDLAEWMAAVQERNTAETRDLSEHWASWRAGWEEKLHQSEVQFLRSVAELQDSFQHEVRTQHGDFTRALESAANHIRLESERLIHAELRLVRQRVELRPVAQGSALQQPAGPAAPYPTFDYGRFAERFRGTEEYVKAGQKVYRPYFAGRKNVLDIGCGRGEFLEMMRAAGVAARGIDLSAESVALCRQKGLDAEVADLFEYLARQPEESLDGIFCSQVVEHLPPERLPEMIRLAASRLARDGTIAIETPNPECLAIFATHFYLDPTHTRPIPHPLLMFYLEEFGIGGIEVKRLAPAVETMPSLAGLPAEFREAFFGGLDYAAIGKKL